MELGVGAVIQTSLYKPLANNDEETISRIVYSAKRFFRIVGIGLVVLVIGTLIAYPIYVRDKFDIFSTILLICALSITMFAQYFFGIVYSLLIQADQKIFIYNIIQIVVIVLNTIVCAFLIINGFSIQIVKFVTAAIFLIRPIALSLYVKKHYNIYKVQLKGDELPQKWNGIAQHIAAYILDNTDIIVLTLFASLSDVSIYSTYYLIVHSIRLLLVSLTNGISSYYGNLLALEEKDKLKTDFNKYNFFIHLITTFMYGSTIILLVPFVLIYTSGVNDADYNQYIFGFILVMGQYFYCIRRSFNMLILAAGHYKQTQMSAIIESLLNVIISIIVVFNFGLIGVAIGTAIAMLFRCIFFAIYCSNNIINRSIILFFKEMLADFLILSISFFIGWYFNKNIVISDYIIWIKYGFIIAFIIGIIVIFVNLIFNFKELKYYISNFKKKTK